MLVYEIRNHWLIKENGKKIEITNLEHELLMALSNRNLITYQELAERIYNTDVKYVINSIRAIKRRLKAKTKLNIRSVKSKGYKMITEICFK